MHLISHLLLSALLISRCDLRQDYGCGQFQKIVTCEERKRILDVHNRFRQAVALGMLMKNWQSPLDSVSNMIELIWNSQLAKRAESWARTCSFGHDITIGRIWMEKPDDKFYRLEVNQNMAFSWSRKRNVTANWDRTIQYWVSGILRNEAKGYYRQVGWVNTSVIGCGIEFFKHPVIKYVKIYVCNYARGGNIDGQENEVGEPNCTRPDLTPSSNYLGLCRKKGAKEEECKD